MATIHAIERRSVHHIQSGQVIVDLNSVVKELVENSLDAGATSVEIRFRNSGLAAVEVQDNGRGIAPDDFETVALKHYTSKLSAYADLTALDTFGFRGEALSSLCALSRFHILTARAQDGALGKKLDFEISGKLKSSTPAAAPKGTTACVQDIFFNLPVRRKELEKNIKREYGKVIGLLYAYACISVGVHFSVTNQMTKGKKTTVFSTKSNTTTKENIANVFGAKTLLALVTLDLHLEMAPARTSGTNDRSLEVHVQGHISKPIFGEGRQAPDRQMFFVNSRPCQLPQVSKAINEVYKSFNVSQSPFIFANLVMDTNAYDVNVSPDKRTIMLHDQTALLETLKNALTELFERTDHTVPQSTLPHRKLSGFQSLTVSRKESSGGTPTNTGREQSSNPEDGESESENESGTPAPVASVIQPAGSPSDLIHNWVGRDSIPRTNASESRLLDGGVGKAKYELVHASKKNKEAMSPAVHVGADESSLEIISARDKSAAARGSSSPASPQRDADRRSPFTLQSVTEVPPLPLLYSHSTNSSDASAPVVVLDAVHDSGPSGSLHHDPFPQKPSVPDSVVEQSHAPTEAMQIDQEEPIPAITPGSQKVPPGPIQSAFDRMRPQRTPREVAEITIGDVTTTTILGHSPPFKKRRIHKPGNLQAVAKYGASPSLADGLRKIFAAPGSQLEIESSGLSCSQLEIESGGLPSSAIRRLSGSASSSDDGSEGEVVTTKPTLTLVPQSRPPNASHDASPSDRSEDLISVPADDDEWDEEYMDEDEKKTREEERVAALVREAEEAATRPTESNLKRAASVLKNGGVRKDCVLKLAKSVSTTSAQIEKQISAFGARHGTGEDEGEKAGGVPNNGLDDDEAESRLSLTVTKADFQRMSVIGQFNLGFIIAARPAAGPDDDDELFIIDQHAADEKFNYERLQRTVSLQSQRLVRPKDLDLTATQEEVILSHTDALKANGFEIETTESLISDDREDTDRTQRNHSLLTLPMSKEKTFDLSDLEELIYLLAEQPAGSSEIPRPKKVQKLLAMRACRSSIMVGKTLTLKQMEKVVRHMGEMEKPWNCPHGRPTMRHLGALQQWRGWREGELIEENEREGCNAQAGRTDWGVYLEKKQPK